MSDDYAYYPDYVPRNEAQRTISDTLAQVQTDGKSRVLLIYGRGGVGKTQLLRHMKDFVPLDEVAIVEAIDIDDPNYWVLTNLHHQVATGLKKYGGYFEEYLNFIQQLSQMPDQAQAIQQGTQLFQRCYSQFTKNTNLTPIISLDTVEAVRSTDLLERVALWMKGLQGSLFVLASRPPRDTRDIDPIVKALEDPDRELPITTLYLSSFDDQAANAYLENTPVGSAISEEEKQKILQLTQHHPLWLALTVDYLGQQGLPSEVSGYTLDELMSAFPDQGQLTSLGERIRESFIRTLLVPYRETSFWSEAVKRLAIARQWINREVWEHLMEDRELPDDVSNWDDAWQQFQKFPWVRSRSNRQYVTLHDALAEEISHFIIPLQDRQETWRQDRWETIALVFDRLIAEKKEAINNTRNAISSDVYKRELHQLLAASFYYQMLRDYKVGCEHFIQLFDEAKNDLSLQELLVVELQTFRAAQSTTIYDAIQPIMAGLSMWLAEDETEETREYRYKLDWRITQYLTATNQTAEADTILTELINQFAEDEEKLCRLYIDRGNARMRTKGLVQVARQDFESALNLAREANADSPLRKYESEAYKEYGLYFRNIGNLREAETNYQIALSRIRRDDRQERASIQANLAYVLTLLGRFEEALMLLEASLITRESLSLRLQMGMCYSIQGEIYRYKLDYAEAWKANLQAEAIFEELGNLYWLATIKQQQAVCMFQASERAIGIPHYDDLGDMKNVARHLIQDAMELCRDYNPRALPSALNRAGRIFGDRDSDQGLHYLDQAIREAQEVMDGRFLFASLIEKAEMCYRILQNTRDRSYETQIRDLAASINDVSVEWPFPELIGRWHILQGYLEIHDALRTHDTAQYEELLGKAIEHCKIGFPLVLDAGITVETIVPDQLRHLNDLLLELPHTPVKLVFDQLLEAWSDPTLGYIKDPKHFPLLDAILSRLPIDG